MCSSNYVQGRVTEKIYTLTWNLEKQNINLKNEIQKEDSRLNAMIKDKNITDLYNMVINLKNVEENLKFKETKNLKKRYPRRTKKQNLKFVQDQFKPQNRYYSTDNSINKINFNT